MTNYRICYADGSSELMSDDDSRPNGFRLYNGSLSEELEWIKSLADAATDEESREHYTVVSVKEES